MALFQLIYLSTMVSDDSDMLTAILDGSVRNNQQRDITGMMLYADGSVMQVLEGEKEVVLKTYKSIEADWRHRDIFVLIEEEIATRQFAAWSMGFVRLSKGELEKFPAALSLFEAREDEIALRGQAGSALAILKSFADGSFSLT
jgi:hypothetical protein